MYITKEELEARLNKTSVLVIERERKTRKKKVEDEDGNIVEQGEKRLNNEDRTLIGILSELDTNKNIAELIGVSAQTVSNNSRGLTSPTIGLDRELRDGIRDGVANIAENRLTHEKRIQEQLVTNLAAALGHVANNLQDTDAIGASKIATDMSKILDRVSGNDGNGNHKGNRTAIIINVPSMKEEKQYQTITV